MSLYVPTLRRERDDKAGVGRAEVLMTSRHHWPRVEGSGVGDLGFRVLGFKLGLGSRA